MKKDIHFTSRALALSGGMLIVSGILMAVCKMLAIGGIFWAAASCMFFAAYHFRLAENKKEKQEDENDEQKAL